MVFYDCLLHPFPSDSSMVLDLCTTLMYTFVYLMLIAVVATSFLVGISVHVTAVKEKRALI